MAGRSRRPHLRTVRDGWRTLRFFLIFSPRWMFWYSGLTLMLLGAVGYSIAWPGLTLAGATFDAHTLVVPACCCSWERSRRCSRSSTTTYAIKQGFRPSSPRVDRFFELFTLERGALAGLAGMALGLLVILAATVGMVPGGIRAARLRDDHARGGPRHDHGDAGSGRHPEQLPLPACSAWIGDSADGVASSLDRVAARPRGSPAEGEGAGEALFRSPSRRGTPSSMWGAVTASSIA